MIVAAVVVEHIGYDGYLRSLHMQADPGRTLTIAFADEFDEPHSGPFHFLDEHYKNTFEKEFAECKTLKLSESNFSVVDDEYRFQTSWQGIPTQRNGLSCYSLSLPEFAVPTEVRFKDPHSGREYSKSVIRDNRLNRFVAYLRCRSSYGSFDFLLDVKFRRDRDNFSRARYTDENTDRHRENIHAYEQLVPIHLQEIVRQFFSPLQRPSAEALSQPWLQKPSGGAPSQAWLFPSEALKSTGRVELVGERTGVQAPSEPRESKLALSHKKKVDLSKYFDGAGLTEAQYEVATLAWEHGLPLSEIARRLGKHRKSIEERLASAKKKIDEARSSEKQAMRRAAHPD